MENDKHAECIMANNRLFTFGLYGSALCGIAGYFIGLGFFDNKVPMSPPSEKDTIASRLIEVIQLADEKDSIALKQKRDSLRLK